MTARSVVHTFPGPVKIIHPGPKGTPAPRLVDVHWPSGPQGRKNHGKLAGTKRGTALHVHPDYDVTYELVTPKRASPTTKPTAHVKLVKRAPAAVLHAELEHVAAKEAEVDGEGNETAPATPAKVIATTTVGDPVSAEGATAEEAVAALRAKLAPKAAASLVTRVGAAETLPPVLKVGEAVLAAEDAEKVERHG